MLLTATVTVTLTATATTTLTAKVAATATTIVLLRVAKNIDAIACQQITTTTIYTNKPRQQTYTHTYIFI